ncbi:MAG: hypothetical protein V3V04_08415 [Rhizobiaceae bacterium]
MDKPELIEAVVKRAFQVPLKFKEPVHVDSPCPIFLTALERFRKELSKAMNEAHSIFQQSNIEALNTLAEGNRIEISRLGDADRKNFRYFISRAEEICPPWFAAGFGVEGYEADYKYWVRVDRWTIDEATALSIGFNPISNIEVPSENSNLYDEAPKYYQKRRRLVAGRFFQKDEFRGIVLEDTIIGDVTPDDFCCWAMEIDLEVPKKLYNSLIEYQKKIVQRAEHSPQEAEKSSLEKRERASLFTLLAGLAIGGYGYNPTSVRSEVPKEIRSDLNKIGLDLSEDTIRKYLREATADLPKDFKAD